MLTRRDCLLASTAVAVGVGMTTACTGRKPDIRPKAGLQLDVFDHTVRALVSGDQFMDVLSSGHSWLEGPAWDRAHQTLYFTDVPENKAFAWSREKGVRIFLDPAGISNDEANGFREPGLNGLLLGRDGTLLMCNHGRRAVESMDLATQKRTTLVNDYNGRAFNSPNDLIQSTDGLIYFTDPPYGLEGLDRSPLKEMETNGVYALSPDGAVERILSEMTFPNGVALSPDQRWLYVSQSDPKAPHIRRVDLRSGHDEVWFDAAPHVQDGPGLPDGMAVATSGHVFATGPAGVTILSPEGEALGRIRLDRPCANCAFGEDGHTLFVAAQDQLLRVRTSVKGLAWA